MSRASIVVIGCLMLYGVVGCERMQMTMHRHEPMAMNDMKRPAPPVQLRELEPFIGSWEGTAEVDVPAGSPAATQPTQTFKGASTTEWTMDGMAMKTSGWHEMPDGQRMTMIEYVTWDPRAEKFKSFYVSDWGESGTGWMWAEPNGQRFHWTGKGSNARGETSSMSGTMTIIDKDSMSWNMVEEGPMGTMRLRGTSRRTANANK
jgi:hypothetical protein